MKINTKIIILPLICFISLLFIGHEFIENNNKDLESNINKLSNELVKSHALILEKSILRNTASASILAKYIEMQNGDMNKFEEFAQTLQEELKGVTNLQLAPNGIVTKIYPLIGHEKALGHDILKNDKRKKEALLAKESEKLTLAGPFKLIQGGVAIIARKPLYIDNNFWGFASALIMIEDLINSTELNKLQNQNYEFRLKRIHPDTNEIDIFYGKKDFINEKKIFSKEINVPNGKWFLDIVYSGDFISDKMIIIFHLLNILISIIISYILYLLLNKTQQLKKMNNELKIEKERFELAINGTNNGLFDWNIETQQIYFSPQWKSLLGYEDNELRNNLEEWKNRIYHEDYEKVILSIENYLSGKINIFNITYRMHHKNEKLIWIEARAKVSRDKDNISKRMVGFHSDVTELIEYRNSLEKKVNEQIKTLRNKDKILLEQSKLASLGEMIGNIAHQWRQPLNTITIAASGLKVQSLINNLKNQDIEEFSDIVIKNANYLSNTIDIFKNYIQGGNEEKEINLQDEVNYSLNIVDVMLKDKHIKLINNINDAPEIKVNLVLGELPQIIVNIINNAKDALLEKNIQYPWIKITLEKQNDYARITIEDNAKGIPENILQNIFEPYFTTKHKSLGTGLGLYMSYKIVNENMNGKLYVKNTENGAKFFIEIPLV